MRDYPPAHTIHELGCPEAPTDLIAFRARGTREAHPNGFPHTCVTSDTVKHNREVVAEPPSFEPHPYAPSAAEQPDATRPLCRTCRGTHPNEPEAVHGLLHPPQIQEQIS
jgi:hypothetical protein